jgi:hypothetical protein
MHVKSVTPAVTSAVAGGFLPSQGEEGEVMGLDKGTQEEGDKSFLVLWALVLRVAQVPSVFLHLAVGKLPGTVYTSSEHKTGRGL